mgnify:CR=1 FL=1
MIKNIKDILCSEEIYNIYSACMFEPTFDKFKLKTEQMQKDSSVSVYGYFLNEKQRTVLEYYYNEDLSLSEIAENVGITRQGVQDLIKRSELQLRSLEDNCHYCEKFIRLKTLSEDIKNTNPELFQIIESL